VVTIDDVARAAGVSTSTVSYALSGRRPISAATRERVAAAIAELGYHPHAGARSLASSRSSVLALVAPLRSDVNVPVIMEFVTAVVTAAREHSYDVLLLTKDEGTAGLQRVALPTAAHQSVRARQLEVPVHDFAFVVFHVDIEPGVWAFPFELGHDAFDLELRAQVEFRLRVMRLGGRGKYEPDAAHD